LWCSVVQPFALIVDLGDITVLGKETWETTKWVKLLLLVRSGNQQLQKIFSFDASEIKMLHIRNFIGTVSSAYFYVFFPLKINMKQALPGKLAKLITN
jgi:hypothetical protein